jgi:hypothetical protein
MAAAGRREPDVTLSTEDRLDVLELLAQADDAATARDPLAYVALFTDDAVLDGAKGEHRGRDALLDAVGTIWASEGAGTVHLTLNAVIQPVAGKPDEAKATSTLVIVTTASPPAMGRLTRIIQHLVRVGGRWRISRRSVAGDQG